MSRSVSTVWVRQVMAGGRLEVTRQVTVRRIAPNERVVWNGKESAMSYQKERTPCVVVRTGDSLAEPYKFAFWNLVRGEASADRVAHAFMTAGLKVGATSIRKHRGGYCACPQKGND